MSIFLCLVQEEGAVVTRSSLFAFGWGNALVGDDSINRALTAIRHMLDAVGADGITIETIPRTGYRLVIRDNAHENEDLDSSPADVALDCWRLGAPLPDVEEIASLQRHIDRSGGNAHEWGLLALLLRKAAEYAEAQDCATYVQKCEHAARNALKRDPRASHARVALAGLAPLFGNWVNARQKLVEVLTDHPGHTPAVHDLAVLEFATGRPRTAEGLIADLITQDEYAATLHYKRIYHLWTLGDTHEAERVSTAGLQLWPRHAAIWNARYWMLIFTDRAEQAQRFVTDQSCPAPLPQAVIQFLSGTAELAAAYQTNCLEQEAYASHLRRCLGAASQGPAQAVSSLMSLWAVGAIDESFEVARGYYLGEGMSVAPLRWHATDPSITDQHRRITQPLFIPAGRKMRKDERFMGLCDDIGLKAYWDRFSITPDFLLSEKKGAEDR